MTMRRLRLIVPVLAVLAIAVSLTIGDTAANGVPATKADNETQTIDANALKPDACAALNLTTIVVGSGDLNGGGTNELIIGDGTGNKLNGNGGNDCIIGGAGKDAFNGGPGTDVCIGNGGGDSYKGCETQS